MMVIGPKGQTLNEVALKSSSIFNISIDQITAGSPSKQDISGHNIYFSLKNQDNSKHNVSANTTLLINEITNHIQPSDKSSF